MLILSTKRLASLERDHPGITRAVEDRLPRRSRSGHLLLKEEEWNRIMTQFGVRRSEPEEGPAPDESNAPERFAEAIKRWIKAGLPVASEKVRAERHAICSACDHWNPKAWLGIGKCRLCGCSRIKLSLATEQCPLKPPKWRALNGPKADLP